MTVLTKICHKVMQVVALLPEALPMRAAVVQRPLMQALLAEVSGSPPCLKALKYHNQRMLDDAQGACLDGGGHVTTAVPVGCACGPPDSEYICSESARWRQRWRSPG